MTNNTQPMIFNNFITFTNIYYLIKMYKISLKSKLICQRYSIKIFIVFIFSY